MMSNKGSSLWLTQEDSFCLKTDSETNHNQVCIRFRSRSENVSLARLMAAAVVCEHDMTIAELDEIKVAVSEAVSNAIIHGYQKSPEHWVEMSFSLEDGLLTIIIHDEGIGIENIEEAMKPHLSGAADRMGLGFAFMQSFMDTVDVASMPGCGTTVTLTKKLS
jgi:stage II sporulation protein AB (anti-sigma F factor)